MASTIIKFPDGRTEEKKLITAYKEVGGVEYEVFDTESFDENQNKIVGVSYKPVNEERFQKIVDIEEWKKAKGILVNDLHDQKESFEYMTPQEETLVTEDFMHNLALRKENLDKLIANYEEYVKSKQTTVEEIQEINPFATQEIVEPQVAEVAQETISEVQPAPIVEEVIPETPSVAPTPEVQTAPIEENIVEAPIFQNVENTNMAQESSTIVDEPNVSSVVEDNNVVDFQPQIENNNPSSVENTYIENINTLIDQMKKITDEYIKQMEHMKNVSIEEFKQIKELRQLAESTVQKAESVMASANNNVEEQQKVLTKVA